MSDATANVYTDFSGLNALGLKARSAPAEAAGEVAQQFEAIFIGMVMKSMREATPEDSLFGSDQMEAYQDIFDKQLALDLATKGGLGLASLIEEQIALSGGLTDA